MAYDHDDPEFDFEDVIHDADARRDEPVTDDTVTDTRPPLSGLAKVLFDIASRDTSDNLTEALRRKDY